MNKLHSLQVIGKMDRGGAETLIMNLMRTESMSDVTFDFLVHSKNKADYDDEIIERGGHIWHIPRYVIANEPFYHKAVHEFFRKHHDFDVVHGHIESSAAIYLQEAKSRGIFTIAHSHSTNRPSVSPLEIAERILHNRIRGIADYYLACSRQAGIDHFGTEITGSNSFEVLKNGIDLPAYVFDSSTRKRVRNELGAGDKIVVCHVGRFVKPKNHDFLLQSFKKFHEKNKNSCLWLVGRGPEEALTRERARAAGINDAVRFLGVCSNIPQILMASDIFVFPSLYEGLGIAAIEAQASGLPCLLSDQVPELTQITSDTYRLPLGCGTDAWAAKMDTMINCPNMRIPNSRSSAAEKVRKAGFDINSSARQLHALYENAAIATARKA